MKDDDGLGGPNITTQTMLDYLNDRLDYDPVTQQFLDQTTAATDDLRGALGIEPDPELLWPSERNHGLQASMWSRLIRESEGDVCTHIAGRPIQPIVVIPQERRQLCAECWDANVSPVRTTSPWAMTNAAARKVPCDGCEQRRFTNITGDDPFGWLHPEFRQWWHFSAPLRLCFNCHKILNELDHIDPELADGIVRERQKRGGGRR